MHGCEGDWPLLCHRIEPWIRGFMFPRKSVFLKISGENRNIIIIMYEFITILWTKLIVLRENLIQSVSIYFL
jgi:hypothetical protein